MSGWPIPPSRDAFGPKPENRHPVTNPKKEMGADTGDLIMWQVAGTGVAACKAWALIDGATETVLASAAVWDPNNSLPPPVVDRSGAGVYLVSYPATAPDKDGIQQPVEFWGAIARTQTLTRTDARQLVRANRREVDVLTYNLTSGSPVAGDFVFLLELR